MWGKSNKWEECEAEHSNKPSETFTIYKLGVNCHKWEADPEPRTCKTVCKIGTFYKAMNREVKL